MTGIVDEFLQNIYRFKRAFLTQDQEQ